MNFPANEPAVVAAFVSAGLTLAATFGLHLTADQIAGVASVVSVVAGFVVRQLVTPTAKLVAPNSKVPS